MSDKFNDRIFALEAANANSTEWAALARDILADLHRAQGSSRYLQDRLAENNTENARLREQLEAMEEELEALSDTNPGLQR
jgi:predicted nuclease with TOPRIM domain